MKRVDGCPGGCSRRIYIIDDHDPVRYYLSMIAENIIRELFSKSCTQQGLGLSVAGFQDEIPDRVPCKV